MKKTKIVVVGSVNTDMVVKVDHIPHRGETILGGDFFQARGGKGANQAVAAARLGAQVTFIAKVGNDTFGEDAIQAFKTEGINTQFVVKDEHAPSGVALIMVNQLGENIIAVAPGANACLSIKDIEAAKDAIRAADCILLQLEIPLETVQAAIELAHQYQVPVILNPAPAIPLPAELLKLVDYLTPNDTEAAILAGTPAETDISSLVEKLQEKVHLNSLVITLGKLGVYVNNSDHDFVEPYQVNSVDTTGAGDAFNGGLAVALARGDTLLQAVKFANAVGALSTTRPGAQSSMPTMNEVTKFISSLG
jgi:ribokinase